MPFFAYLWSVELCRWIVLPKREANEGAKLGNDELNSLIKYGMGCSTAWPKARSAIDDPQTMAQVLARRMGCDVQVGYYKDCEYDEAERRVYSIPYAFVPLGTRIEGEALLPV